MRKHGRYRYGTKVKHTRRADRIRPGLYRIKGTFYDKPASKFPSGPKILRPKREEG